MGSLAFEPCIEEASVAREVCDDSMACEYVPIREEDFDYAVFVNQHSIKLEKRLQARCIKLIGVVVFAPVICEFNQFLRGVQARSVDCLTEIGNDRARHPDALGRFAVVIGHQVELDAPTAMQDLCEQAAAVVTPHIAQH
jgi:hypothetical protein